MENGWCPEEVLAGSVWNSWLIKDGNWLFLQFTCRCERSSLSQRGHRQQDRHCFHDNRNFPCLSDLCWAVVWDKDFKQHCAGHSENIPVGNTRSVPNAMFCCSLQSIVTLLCRSLCLFINHRCLSDIRLYTKEPPLVPCHLFFRSKTLLVFGRGGFVCESCRKSQWVSLLRPADQGGQVRIPWLSVKIRTTHWVKDVSGAVHDFPQMKLIKPVIQDKATLHTDTQG